MQADHSYANMLETLESLDPNLAASVREVLERADPPIPVEAVGQLVDETIWGIAREESFGLAIASGYLKLFDAAQVDMLTRYRDVIRESGKRGNTIGRLLAIHLVPVLIHGGSTIVELFLGAVNAMENKGTYTLLHPLEALTELFDSGDRNSAAVFLELLLTTFGAELNYNQCQHLSRSLPKAAREFAPSKRSWQLEQLLRIVRADVRLCDDFLSGMDKGLHLLSPATLHGFVSNAIEIAKKNFQSARSFLSLASKRGFEAFSDLQVAVSLKEMLPQLNRYLHARTGLALSVRPSSTVSDLSTFQTDDMMETCSDGRFIYLPDEIAFFDDKTKNADLYKCLLRFEIGNLEFDTFNFDIDRLRDRCLDHQIRFLDKERPAPSGFVTSSDSVQSDLEQFFGLFPAPELAVDLFTIFEHGRIRCLLHRRYPGLIKSYLPILQKEARHQVGLLTNLYAIIALDLPLHTDFGLNQNHHRLLERFVHVFKERADIDIWPVEMSAEMVCWSYDFLASDSELDILFRSNGSVGSRLRTPFNRRLRPDLVMAARKLTERKVSLIQNMLNERGYKVYRADIRKSLLVNKGTLDKEDLATIIKRAVERTEQTQPDNTSVYETYTKLLESIHSGIDQTDGARNGEMVCPMNWYREWNCHLGDYLNDHTCVRDRQVAGSKNLFYERTLDRHRGLVNRIRYSFELLKPEGLKLCRQWIEGDEFDYRALLDFILDKRAGRTPSDRLYLKRLKEIRDVAVLLLVDLSRSTANTIVGSTNRVLDVEKEAIVLLSEALEVVGDTYAIAGFSGNGRLGVDYFHIKDFGDPMGPSTRHRINAIMPQRNTRMGAAIRHAAALFDSISSKVRLLIVLGDGYPNDLDYKKDYAIEDTCRAISEIRSKNIHVHAITVNINPEDNSRLDTLYGEIHHNVIANVLELPEKLWRIYGAITR
jgi:hypothetical protein